VDCKANTAKSLTTLIIIGRMSHQSLKTFFMILGRPLENFFYRPTTSLTGVEGDAWTSYGIGDSEK
jgi:hypothetical protein